MVEPGISHRAPEKKKVPCTFLLGPGIVNDVRGRFWIFSLLADDVRGAFGIKDDVRGFCDINHPLVIPD